MSLSVRSLGCDYNKVPVICACGIMQGEFVHVLYVLMELALAATSGASCVCLVW